MSAFVSHTEGPTASLRDVMSNVCTPVTVVTSYVDGIPFGTTVSAFCSLSMEPPMVLVALDRTSETLRAVTTSQRFGVNILGSDSAVLAAAFAQKGNNKFDGVEWSLSSDLPRVGVSAAWVACEVDAIVEGGDHMIISGRVVEARTGRASPLTYHRRRFGTSTALPVEN